MKHGSIKFLNNRLLVGGNASYAFILLSNDLNSFNNNMFSFDVKV